MVKLNFRLDKNIDLLIVEIIELVIQDLNNVFGNLFVYEIFDFDNSLSSWVIKYCKNRQLKNSVIDLSTFDFFIAIDPFRFEGNNINHLLSDLDRFYYIYKYDNQMVIIGDQTNEEKILTKDEMTQRDGISVFILNNQIGNPIPPLVGLSKMESKCKIPWAVVSTYYFNGINGTKKIMGLKACLFHEIGHVLNAPPDNIPDPWEFYGLHHKADKQTGEGTLCVMRQGINIPEHWLKFGNDIKNNSVIYCPLCFRKIKNTLKHSF